MRSEDFVGDPASSRAFPNWETVTVDGKDYLVPPEDDPIWRLLQTPAKALAEREGWTMA